MRVHLKKFPKKINSHTSTCKEAAAKIKKITVCFCTEIQQYKIEFETLLESGEGKDNKT